MLVLRDERKKEVHLLHSKSIPTMNIAIEGDDHDFLVKKTIISSQRPMFIFRKFHLSSVVVAETSDPICLFAFLLL